MTIMHTRQKIRETLVSDAKYRRNGLTFFTIYALTDLDISNFITNHNDSKLCDLKWCNSYLLCILLQ